MNYANLLEEGLRLVNLSLLPSGNNSDSDSDFENDDEGEGPDIEEEIPSTSKVKKKNAELDKSSNKNLDEADIDLNNLDVYVQFGSTMKMTEKHDKLVKKKRTTIDKVLKKSVIVPGFEKLHSVPRYDVSDRMMKLERKKVRELTKGDKWFNMPATEITEDVKRDLEILQMRSVLDPKQFYKKNDLKVLPKFFHVGRVVDAPVDFYNSRVPKRERKKTMVEELLADAQFKQYNKKRYKEIIEERRKSQFKPHKHSKRLKRKGKSKK